MKKCNLCRSLGGMLAKAQEAYAAHMKPFCADYCRLTHSETQESIAVAESLAKNVLAAKKALAAHQEKHDAQPAGAR